MLMTSVEGQSLFHEEYREELEAWLRRRFRYLCTTYLVVGGIDLLWTIFTRGDAPLWSLVVQTLGDLLVLALVTHYLFGRDLRGADRTTILTAATHLVLLIGFLSLAVSVGMRLTDPGRTPFLLLALFFWHFSACLLLPWTPRESLRPFVPLLIAWALIVLILPAGAPIVDRVLIAVFGPVILLPGLTIAAVRLRRHGRRFRREMVGSQFRSMSREFHRARAIHENLFPAPYDDGYVRFEYTYAPMRELGGDYVHLHVGAEGLVHVTLIDVTGHGLAAALTVNRLYGELERIRAEAPRVEPGEVLVLLNRYIHLTLIKHDIYATAACLTLDPYLGELSWANAGHPPGFLRGANGVIRELAATTMVLGAQGDPDFRADPETIDLAPGDTLVLFTDGAFEARDRTGRRFGLERLRELIRIRPTPHRWSRFLAAAVAKHNGGRTEDDVLIMSLTYHGARGRSGRTREAAPAEAGASESASP